MKQKIDDIIDGKCQPAVQEELKIREKDYEQILEKFVKISKESKYGYSLMDAINDKEIRPCPDLEVEEQVTTKPEPKVYT